MRATEWQPTPPLDRVFELTWIRFVQDSHVTFIGAIYHPPMPLYKPADILSHIEDAVLRINLECPGSHIVLAGDLNTLPDSEVINHSNRADVDR